MSKVFLTMMVVRRVVLMWWLSTTMIIISFLDVNKWLNITVLRYLKVKLKDQSNVKLRSNITSPFILN